MENEVGSPPFAKATEGLRVFFFEAVSTNYRRVRENYGANTVKLRRKIIG